jgi:hypothetical protein
MHRPCRSELADDDDQDQQLPLPRMQPTREQPERRRQQRQTPLATCAVVCEQRTDHRRDGHQRERVTPRDERQPLVPERAVARREQREDQCRALL